jgi:hypothetical protein
VAVLRGHSWSIPLTNGHTQACRSHPSSTSPYQTLQNVCRGINIVLKSKRCGGYPHCCHRSLRGVSSTPFVDPSLCQRSMRVLFTWRLPSILEWPRCLCAQRGGPRRVSLRSITISNFSLSPWILIEERKMNRVFIMKSPCRQVQH